MGRTDEKKRIKNEALLDAAYKLFISKGMAETSISDIVKKAGVAKGTFYLYFKDKYDLRHKLVVRRTNKLFLESLRAMQEADITGLEEKMVFLTNHILEVLRQDKSLMRLISKDLVMGALKSTLLVNNDGDEPSFYEQFLKEIETDACRYENVDVMLFTIVELVGSTVYNAILYEEPLPLDEYKPFLYRTIRLIVASHRVEE